MPTWSPESFRQHIKKAHHVLPLTNYLREIVYGGSDGIVTTFAVVAGFTGAQHMTGPNPLPILTVIVFGLANLLADAFSMGLGNLLSNRSQHKIYTQQRNIETKHLTRQPQFELAETEYLLTTKGFSPEQSRTLAQIFSTNPEFWLEFMMRHELHLPADNEGSEWVTSIVTFLSFVGFGLIPLLPYLLSPDSPTIFVASVTSTFGALTLLGLLRWWMTKETLWRALLEVFLITGVSAGIAFMVGRVIVA